MPVVAETYDGVLNDINALHVTPEHAIAALNARSTGPVAEGSTGGGNGMIAYEFKGGTGTSSRRVQHRRADLHRGGAGAGQSRHPALADDAGPAGRAS